MTTARDSHAFYRHDLIVLLGGAALVAIGVIASATNAAPAYALFERDGLSVPYPHSARWFPPTSAGYPAVIGSAQCSSDPDLACGDQPTARIVVAVYDDAMGLGAVRSGRDHDAAYGGRARRVITAEALRNIAGKMWTCMRFAYVPVGAKSESAAIECSLAHRRRLYVVTLSGPESYLSALEPDIIDNLVVRGK